MKLKKRKSFVYSDTPDGDYLRYSTDKNYAQVIAVGTYRGLQPYIEAMPGWKFCKISFLDFEPLLVIPEAHRGRFVDIWFKRENQAGA